MFWVIVTLKGDEGIKGGREEGRKEGEMEDADMYTTGCLRLMFHRSLGRHKGKMESKVRKDLVLVPSRS